MLTRIVIENFKRIDKADIELGDTVVFVGPNNSGKTTALQALALWSLGLSAWISKKGKAGTARARTGVTLNRRELIAVPVPSAALLWRDTHTRATSRENGKQKTRNILFTVRVEGVLDGKLWSFGLEFDYANPESFYCRPVELPDEASRERIVRVAQQLRVAYLPPMSGLATREFRSEMGQINVLIGEGQTAQVLRNLCWYVYSREDKSDWQAIVMEMRDLFGVTFKEPRYIAERSEIELSYKSERAIELDLSSAGRGLQQTLLLLTYLHAHPGATILLDEPDAHLEVLRQRQIYNVICRLAQRKASQIIAATHSEIVLDEAAGRDTVIAFIGQPHRINDRASQARKALLSIGYADYLQAETKGWVLYLEGSTDLSILQTLAARLEHQDGVTCLERPYVDYVNSNTPPTARERFFGLREARADLRGIALFDRLEKGMQLQADADALTELCWAKREIENYLCTPATLLSWAGALAGPRGDYDDLFVRDERERYRAAMRESIVELESALKVTKKPDPWGPDIKATDDFLDPLFENFLNRVGLPLATMYKKNYHQLADHIPLAEIDVEIRQKLDAVVAVAAQARPVE